MQLLEHFGEESCPNANILADAEAFVHQLHNKGTEEININKGMISFRRTRKKLHSLPPTQDALQLCHSESTKGSGTDDGNFVLCFQIQTAVDGSTMKKVF